MGYITSVHAELMFIKMYSLDHISNRQLILLIINLIFGEKSLEPYVEYLLEVA